MVAGMHDGGLPDELSVRLLQPGRGRRRREPSSESEAEMNEYLKDPAKGWCHRCEIVPRRDDDTGALFADHPGDGVSDGIVRARLDGYMIIPMPSSRVVRNQIIELAIVHQQRGEPVHPGELK